MKTIILERTTGMHNGPEQLPDRVVYNTESDDIEEGHSLESDYLQVRGLNGAKVVGVIPNSEFRFLNKKTGEFTIDRHTLYDEPIPTLEINGEGSKASAKIKS